MAKSFIQYFEDSFKENWDLPAMTNYETKQTFAYKDVAREITKLHVLFKELNLTQDDKIAIMGGNTPEWAFVFLATITYGAVIVPILVNSPSEDIEYIVNHSDSKLLFVDDLLWPKVDKSKDLKVNGVLALSDYKYLYKSKGNEDSLSLNNLTSLYLNKYPCGIQYSDMFFYDKKDDLLILNYTSGTTGYGKAVMLSGNNFCNFFRFANRHKIGGKGYRFICELPLAHLFAYASEIFLPVINGSHITFLPSFPSPQALLQIIQEIKPKSVMTVPLVLETIYKSKIVPFLQKLNINNISDIPQPICKELHKQISAMFGGEFDYIILAGAKLNIDVEKFLHKIDIPYGVTYGMTEATVVSVNIKSDAFGSVGQVIDDVAIMIDSDDPYRNPGEILVKGENVMLGYYKNDEQTQLAFTEDGWLKTGDLGVIDRENNLYVKGRCKTMILTSSGQNVYPEAIEIKLNRSPYIAESVVVQDRNKIVALIYPSSKVDSSLSESGLSGFMETIRKEVNLQLSSYEYISEFRIQSRPFEKTSKNSIKRHLYEIKKK